MIRSFLNDIIDNADGALQHEEFPLDYTGGAYSLLRLASPDICEQDRVFLLTAGFHGNEQAGPLTLRDTIGRIAEAVHRADMKLICYPLLNPSGFVAGTRYNIDGQRGNNDFLRYELANGDMLDDMPESIPFRRWHWSSEEFLGVDLPLETRLMHSLLRHDLRHKVAVALDLHQDDPALHTKALARGEELWAVQPNAYHYGFGDTSTYAPIVRRLEQVVPVLRDTLVAAGYENGVGVRSDHLGFIERHDGTISDLCYRSGVQHAIAVETTTVTPFERANAVNLIWIDGLLKLVGNKY